MAKKPTLTDITAGFASATTYNNNNQEILDAFENTLSRDGSTPNSMSSDLDFNSNDLLNVKDLSAKKITLNGTAISTSVNEIPENSITSTELALSIISVTEFGAKGDGTTDDSTAIQAAIDAAQAAGGGIVFFPSGSYLVNTQLTIAYGSIGLGGLGSVELVGSGMHNTEIRSGVTNDYVLAVTSSTFQTVAFNIRDIKIEGSNNGHGVSVSDLAQFSFERVFFHQLKIGLQTEDCLTMSFHHCIWRWNWYGIIGLKSGGSSAPNAWSFYGCVLANNHNQGMEITNPGQLTYVGGSIEGNGHTLQGTETQAFGAKIVDDATGPEGRGGTFIGTYFDNNEGLADLWLHCSTGASLSFINAYACRFVRSISDPAQYGIRADVGATARAHITARDCVLSQHSSYTPSAANDFIKTFEASGAVAHLFAHNILYDDDTEAVTDFPSPSLFASCHFNGTVGTVGPNRELNVASITDNGTGDYTLTFKEGWLSNKKVAITLNAPGFAYKGTETATTLQILTVDTDGTTAKDFSEVDVLVFQ